MAVSEFAPEVYEAMGQLVGGTDRIADGLTWSDAFIINYRLGADVPRQDPNPDFPGWHKDGDFFIHFLDSPEQALLVVVLWDDVSIAGGPTWIACDSIAPIARFLAAHPEGVSPFGPNSTVEGVPDHCPWFTIRETIHECHDFRAMHGRAGDVVLMHPYMLHTSSPNWACKPRFITNPAISLKEPMQFDRPDGGYSVVEQSILDALGVDRLDFQPTHPRTRIVPPRLQY